MNRKNIDYAELSLIGRRPTNEDRALCEVKESSSVGENQVILAVADGMGKSKIGDVASKAICDHLLIMHREGLPGNWQHVAGRIENCIKLCSRSIYDWSQQKKGAQVGTTVSGAIIIGNRCLVFNVGDSRTYVINAGGIKQLSIDHSADREAYEAGLIKKEEIRKGQFSSTLTRAVGTGPDVKVDVFPYELKKGDILFSCTDGLWGKVTDEDIMRLIQGKRSIQKSLEALYKLAYKKGSKDNISMAAYQYGGYEAQPGLEIKKTPASLTSGDTADKKQKPQKEKKKIKYLKPLLYIAIVVFAVLVFKIIDLTNGKVQDKGKGFEQRQVIGPGLQGGAIESGLIGSATGLNKRMLVKYYRALMERVSQTVTRGKGGVIHFEPDGGEFLDSVKVQIVIDERLKSPKDKLIDADIYYTLDGSDPSKEKGMKYKRGESVLIQTEGTYTLKARLISDEEQLEGPICSQTYIIETKVIGGSVRFDTAGGEYKGPLQIQLNFDSLQYSGGKAIESDLYYTTGGSEMIKANWKQYSPGEFIVFTEEGNYTVRARVISKDGKYKGAVFPQTYTIQYVHVVGGKIRFTKLGGQYTGAIQVQMDFESLKFSGGEVIDSDLYYTTGAGEPVKVDGKRYSSVKLELTKEGNYPLMAWVSSKDGKYKGVVYSQVYSVHSKPLVLSELDREVQTTTNNIELFNIDADNVNSMNIPSNTIVNIQFVVDKNGKVEVAEIEGSTDDFRKKLVEFKLKIRKAFQDKLGNARATRNGMPVNAIFSLKFSVASNKKLNKIIFKKLPD